MPRRFPRVFLLLLACLLCLTVSFAQDAPTLKACDHDLSRLAAFDKVRFIPARFTELEGDTAHFRAVGRDELRLASVELRAETVYAVTAGRTVQTVDRKHFEKRMRSGEWLVWYCHACKAALAIRLQ